MLLSINITNLLWRYDFEKCAKLYSEAGFDAADYSLEEMVNDANVFNTDNYRDQAEKIKTIANSNGLTVNQTHSPFSFRQFPNEEYYKSVIYPRIIRSIEISALLGAKTVVIHPLHHFEFKGHEEEIFIKNMDFYRSLLPYCKEFDIKVGIENMYQVDKRRKYIIDDTCSRSPEFVRYIDTLDSEYMVACLDIGHIGLALRDDEAQDVIRALGHDRLKALHVHDNDYRGDQHNLPYFGKVNWKEVTKALGEINYDGDFTYEVNSAVISETDDEFAPVAAKYMADVGKHLISEIEKNRK